MLQLCYIQVSSVRHLWDTVVAWGIALTVSHFVETREEEIWCRHCWLLFSLLTLVLFCLFLLFYNGILITQGSDCCSAPLPRFCVRLSRLFSIIISCGFHQVVYIDIICTHLHFNTISRLCWCKSSRKNHPPFHIVVVTGALACHHGILHSRQTDWADVEWAQMEGPPVALDIQSIAHAWGGITDEKSSVHISQQRNPETVLQ